MGTEGTGVWKGYDYGGETGLKETRVWRGHGYGRDMGMEREQGTEGT